MTDTRAVVQQLVEALQEVLISNGKKGGERALEPYDLQVCSAINAGRALLARLDQEAK